MLKISLHNLPSFLYFMCLERTLQIIYIDPLFFLMIVECFMIWTYHYLFHQFPSISLQFLNYHKYAIIKHSSYIYKKRVFLQVRKLSLREVNTFCLKAHNYWQAALGLRLAYVPPAIRYCFQSSVSRTEDEECVLLITQYPIACLDGLSETACIKVHLEFSEERLAPILFHEWVLGKCKWSLNEITWERCPTRH